MDPCIRVRQGRFRVHTVDIRYATKDLLVLEIDCHSKYPDGCGIAWGGEDGPRVTIWDGGRSLNLDDTTDLPTDITLPKYTDDWMIMTDARRYSVTITAYNRKHRKRQIWQSD